MPRDASYPRDFFGNPLGLSDKFMVVRVDGQSAPGKKHHECRYFVLDMSHDIHAYPAIKAYAESCKETKPYLARDLFRWCDEVQAALDDAEVIDADA